MEIVKQQHFNHQVAKSLNDSERKMVIANKSTQLRQMETNEIATNLMASIGEAVLITGEKKKHTDDIVQISVHVSQMLRVDFATMKIEETKLAIKNGAFGKYASENDVVFVSPKNVAMWCRAYQSDKLQTLKKQMEFEAKTRFEKETAIRDAKLKTDFENNVAKMIIEESKLDEPSEMAFLTYKILNDTGILQFDPGRKKEILNQCKMKIRNTKKSLFLKPTEMDVENIAINEAKGIVLHEWFDSLIRGQIDVIASECQYKYKQLNN